jgi:hypothetical protein
MVNGHSRSKEGSHVSNLIRYTKQWQQFNASSIVKWKMVIEWLISAGNPAFTQVSSGRDWLCSPLCFTLWQMTTMWPNPSFRQCAMNIRRGGSRAQSKMLPLMPPTSLHPSQSMQNRQMSNRQSESKMEPIWMYLWELQTWERWPILERLLKLLNWWIFRC